MTGLGSIIRTAQIGNSFEDISAAELTFEKFTVLLKDYFLTFSFICLF